MRKTAISILGIAFATLISAKSQAQEVIIVKEQPPAPKIEIVGNPPEPGAHWISGHWKWENNTWVWMAGRWSQPPHPSAFWAPDYWGWRPFGWVHRRGFWVY